MITVVFRAFISSYTCPLMPPASLSLQPSMSQQMLLPGQTLQAEFSRVLGCFQGDQLLKDPLGMSGASVWALLLGPAQLSLMERIWWSGYPTLAKDA